MQEESLGLLGLFVSAFVSSTIAPGGSEAVLAYMVSENSERVMDLVTVATIGNTLGAMTTLWLGYLAAKKFPPEQVLPKKKQRSINSVKKWGSWVLLFSWLPVIGDGLCFAAGWIKLSLLSAFLAILIGKAIRYSVIAYLTLTVV